MAGKAGRGQAYMQRHAYPAVEQNNFYNKIQTNAVKFPIVQSLLFDIPLILYQYHQYNHNKYNSYARNRTIEAFHDSWCMKL